LVFLYFVCLHKKLNKLRKKVFRGDKLCFHSLGEMETFGNEKVPKNPHKYLCNKCNYKTRNRKDYNKHLTTAKHMMETDGNVKVPIIYECDNCSRLFNSRSGLWKHSKKCNDIVIDTTIEPNNTNNEVSTIDAMDSTLVVELLKQNNEFKQLMVEQNKQIQEQNKQILDLAKNSGNTTNNITNNTTNNSFNLNVFLNEKCKDAMSLTDFVKSLEISMEDFIQTGELGFVDGLSRVMIERINNMDLYNRPIHCTDLKRETLYIKDAEKWEKDADKEQLRKAVKGVAYKNDSMRPIWYSETPDVDVLGSENCEKFFKYSQAALGGYGKEQTKSFEDKIMKNIMKQVTIDKENH